MLADAARPPIHASLEPGEQQTPIRLPYLIEKGKLEERCRRIGCSGVADIGRCRCPHVADHEGILAHLIVPNQQVERLVIGRLEPAVQRRYQAEQRAAAGTPLLIGVFAASLEYPPCANQATGRLLERGVGFRIDVDLFASRPHLQ